MDDLDRPPLGAYVYEEIALAQHKIDLDYAERLRPFYVARWSPIFSSKPLPPKRPAHLSETLCAYACALFDVEAGRYPLEPTLSVWLQNLANRVEASVISRAFQPGILSGFHEGLDATLEHHAPKEQMREEVSKALQSNLQPYLLRHSAAALAETAIISHPAKVSRDATADKPLSKQLAELCEECLWTVEELAEAIELSPRSVYRHLSEDATPRKRQLAAYEKAFSTKLKRQVLLKRQINVR